MYTISNITVESTSMEKEHQQQFHQSGDATMMQQSQDSFGSGIIVRYAVEVITPIEHLWEIFLDKVKNPSRYDPQITAVHIMEQAGSDQVERVITIGGTKMLRENIAIDSVTRTILYKMVDDNCFLGYISNALYEDEETGIVTMEFLMNWTAKSSAAPHMNEDYATQVLRDVVNYTKDIAEHDYIQQKASPFAFNFDQSRAE